MIFKPLETLAYTAAAIQNAAAGAHRVLAVLDSVSEVTDSPGAQDLPSRARGEIVFEDVSFGYRPGEPVLSNFSLEIPAGQTVALVGLSGAGKTTALPRLSQMPCSMRETTVHSLRKSISEASPRAAPETWGCM